MSNKEYIQIKVRIRRSHEPSLFQHFVGIPQQWRAEMVRHALLAALARGLMPTIKVETSPSPSPPPLSPVAPARPVVDQEPPPQPVQKATTIDDEALARMARLNRFD